MELVPRQFPRGNEQNASPRPKKNVNSPCLLLFIQYLTGYDSTAKLGQACKGFKRFESTHKMAAKVITVYNAKGGAGKSTVSMNLAASMALRGYRALVIDMDKQRNAVLWANKAEEGSPFPATVIDLAETTGTMHRHMKAHLDNYDVIVVDCPPSVDALAAKSALLVSDLALVPVKPSPGDVDATVGALKVFNEALITNESLVVRFVASDVPRTALAKLTLQSLRRNEDYHFLDAEIPNRAAYAEAQLIGASVHVIPRAEAVVKEFEAVTAEILKVLSLPKRARATS